MHWFSWDLIGHVAQQQYEADQPPGSDDSHVRTSQNVRKDAPQDRGFLCNGGLSSCKTTSLALATRKANDFGLGRYYPPFEKKVKRHREEISYSIGYKSSRAIVPGRMLHLNYKYSWHLEIPSDIGVPPTAGRPRLPTERGARADSEIEPRKSAGVSPQASRLR